MHTFSLSHSRPINIFFRNALSEGGVSSISESHETVDHPSHEDIFRGEFLRLLENKDFRDRLETAIKESPNVAERGELMNAYLGLEATRKKVEDIHRKTQGDLHALMAQLKPSQDSVSA